MGGRRERMEFVISGGRPWGFSVKGGRESHNKPLTISKMEKGGKAEASGLAVGDRLFSVNNVPLTGVRAEAIKMIKMSGATLTMEVERAVAPPTRYDSPAQGSDVDFYPMDTNGNPLPTQYGKMSRPISTDFTEDPVLLSTDPPQHTVSSETVNVIDKRSPVFNGGLAQHHVRHRPGRDKNFAKERPRSWHASKWEVDSSTSPEFKTGMKSPASDTQQKRSSRKWTETPMLKSAVIMDPTDTQRIRSPSTTSTYSSSRSSRASLDNLDNLPRNHRRNSNISRSSEDFGYRRSNNVNSKKAMFEKMAASSNTSHSGSVSPPNSTYNEFTTQHQRQASSRESLNSEEINDVKLVRTTVNKSRGVVTEEVTYPESDKSSSAYPYRKQASKETSDFPYFPHGSQHHMSVVKPVKPVAPGLATHVTDELKPVEIKSEEGQPRYFGVMAVHSSDSHKTSPQRYEHLKDASSGMDETSSTVSSQNTDYVSRKFAKSKSTAQLPMDNSNQYNNNFHRSFDDDKLRASGRYGEIWTPPNKSTNNYDPLWKAQSVAMPDNQSPVNHRRTSSTEQPPQSTNPSSTEQSPASYSSNVYHSRRAIYSPNSTTSSSMLKFIQNNVTKRPSSAKVESSVTPPSSKTTVNNLPEPEEKEDDEIFCRQIKEMSNKVLRVTSFTRKDLHLTTVPKNTYTAQKYEPNRKPAYQHIKHISHGRSRSYDNELDEGSSYMRRSSVGKSPRPKSADANKHAPQLRQTIAPTIEARAEPQIRQTVSPTQNQRSAPHDVTAARLHFFPPRRSIEHVKGPEAKAFTAKALSEFVRRKQAGSSPSASEGRPKSHYSSEELSSADEPDVFDDDGRSISSPDASSTKLGELMEQLDHPKTEKEKRYMQKMKNSSLPLNSSATSHTKPILPAHKKSTSVDMDLSTPPSVIPPPRKQRDRSSNASSATTTSTLSSFSSGSTASNNNKKLPSHPPVLQEIENKDEANTEPISVAPEKKKKPAFSTNTYIIKKKTKNTENLPEVPSVYNTKLTIGPLKSPTEEKNSDKVTSSRTSNVVKISTEETIIKSSSKKSLIFPVKAEDLPPPPPPPPAVTEEEDKTKNSVSNGNVTPPLEDSYKEQTYILDSDGDQKQEVEESFPPPPSFVQLPQTYENIIEIKEKLTQEEKPMEPTPVEEEEAVDVHQEEEESLDETDSSSDEEDDESKKIISEDLAPQDLTEDVIKNDQSLAPLLSSNNKKMRDYVQEIMPSPESKKQRKRQKKNGEQTEKTSSDHPPLSETTATNNLPASSTYYSTSASKKKILDLVQEKVAEGKMETENEDDNIAKKLKLVQSIKNKLNDLQNVREVLKVETRENEELGAGLLHIIQDKCTRKEQEKYSLLVEETHQIINLILSISGRMARVENALAMLPADAPDFEKESLKSKKQKLQEQHEEAKSIKLNIDKRQQTVSEILAKNLDPQDFQDYEDFMKTKISLIIDSRELEDKVKLGREQIHILVDSLPYEHQNNMDDY